MDGFDVCLFSTSVAILHIEALDNLVVASKPIIIDHAVSVRLRRSLVIHIFRSLGSLSGTQFSLMNSV